MQCTTGPGNVTTRRGRARGDSTVSSNSCIARCLSGDAGVRNAAATKWGLLGVVSQTSIAHAGAWRYIARRNVHLLGTASADGWPAAYCDCDVCEFARAAGGPNIRSRTGALIDDDLKIDHSPDTVVHMQMHRRSMAKVRSIVFTHEHPDHLFAIELKRTMNLARHLPPQPPIAVYGNEPTLKKITEAFKDPAAFRLDLKPPLKPFEPVTLADGRTTILPLAAMHCEEALLFRITRDGRSLFYGHDSGLYPAATLDALQSAGPVDVALLDCTHTTRTGLDFKHHLGIETMLRMTTNLRRRGVVTDQTRLIATHFSPHSGAKSHEELVRLLLPHGVEVAFDGMRFDV
jgi:phosphoribosyl 1,2-cyclic phosphate phosphodiesterase